MRFNSTSIHVSASGRRDLSEANRTAWHDRLSD